MKTAVYHGSNDIRIEEAPKPKIRVDEILVEMKACGICGSDLIEWYLESRAPLVLGHEPAGIVAEIGDKVEDFEPGERVFVHHHVACLTCHHCLRGHYTMCDLFRQTHIYPGGFTEYFKVPAPNLHLDTLKIPEDISFEEATLIEPVACCLRAQMKCGVQPGDTVVIIGAGPSGIINSMLSRSLGASQIIISDLVRYRREAAKRLGADLTVDPRNDSLIEKVREVTDGTGADLVIVTVPNAKAYLEGIDVCRRGGTLCVFAPTAPDEYLQLSPNRLFFSEIKVIPSYSTSHIETRTALKLMSSGKIRAKEIITHRFPLNRIAEAFKTATKNKKCLKVVVQNK